MAEMIVGARWFLDVPAPPVLGGGVLSVARVIDNPPTHALMGSEYTTDACATAQEWLEDWCDMTPATTKVFDTGWELVQGDPFVAYTGLECMLTTLPEAKDRALTRFDYAEGRSVDKNIAAWLDANAAIDLGGPFPVNEAIGVAEAYAATVYGGVPTLLIPRQFVPCACGYALRSNLDGSLTTCQGAQVANITTPITLPVAAGATGTMYVTGQITLLRGEVMSYSTPQQVLDDTGRFAPPRALAERIYVPLIECLTAKVEVTCS
jgi:hypothetical protein